MSAERDYQVCVRCVMDTSDSKISFDHNGYCDHCINFERKIAPSWLRGEQGSAALMKLSEKIKKIGSGNDFDCIVGLSGGLDSSYTAYVAKEVMGLRPLLFHVDAGWNSQIAVNNIERLVDSLGLDLYTEVINWKEMRDIQLPCMVEVDICNKRLKDICNHLLVKEKHCQRTAFPNNLM